MSRMVAVVSVFSTPELLPHFVRHYHRLGVDRVCVALNCEFATGSLEAEFGNFLRIQRTTFDRFTNSFKHAGEEELLKAEHLDRDDWVLHLDLDEFHQYPAHLRDVIEIAEARNIWAVMGRLYDRVSADGTLQPVKPDAPLDGQYPLGGRLTHPLVHGCSRKVMFCRRRVKLVPGRHDTRNGHLDRWPVGHPSNYRVHHFRWTEGLIERLETRWSRADQVSFIWARKNLEFVKDYRERGRIDLELPELEIRPAAMGYPERNAGIRQLAKLENSWGLDARELEALGRQVERFGVRTVLEFGTGYSTAALAGCGCAVTSLEADAGWFARCHELYAHPQVDIRHYTPGHPIQTDLPADARYDLCFVDGPRGKGTDSRLDSVMYAMQHTNRIILHDSKRPGEQDTIRKAEAQGWKTEVIAGSRRGMTLLSKP